MNTLLFALRFVWRDAVKKPATSLLIVITLALGIGVNAAIFSMTWQVLLAPLPYTDGDRLVVLKQNEASSNRLDFNWAGATFGDFRKQTETLSDVLGYNQWSLSFFGQGEPWQGYVGLVTGNFFEVLGVQPIIGRNLNANDDKRGAEPVLVLSYELWTTRFASDPGVIDTTLEIQRMVYRIVGVLPPIPAYPHANDAWIPDASNPYDISPMGEDDDRDSFTINRVIGKLQEGVSLEQAASEMEVIARRLAASYPDAIAADYVVTPIPVKDEMTRDSTITMLLLMAIAVLVVLIASANVAGLNLSRAMARQQELAVREAVGASPGRIARQLLAESILLALVGGVLGLLLAWPCLDLLADFASRYTPLASEIGMSGVALAASLALALVTGLLGSAASILGRRDINGTLKEGGDKATTSASGVQRRTTLLVVQFALAFTVLTISMLIVLSLWRLNRQDTGFELDQVLAVNMILNIDLSEPQNLSGKMRNFARSALTAISEIPEVSGAAIRTGAPLLEEAEFARLTPFEVEGRSDAETPPLAMLNMVSENYFSMMEIPLLQGRPFLPSDDLEAMGVAVVNESFARLFLPEGNPIGSNVRLPGREGWYSIIGLVADVRSVGLDEEEGPVVYFSYWQFSTESVNVYVTTAANPGVVASSISDAVHELESRQALLIKPLHEVKSAWLAPARLRATLISLFGALALVVTVSGVVGVISCNINQRVREIGVRMALGATPARVMRLFVMDGLAMCAGGTALGLCLMLAAAPLLQPLLYGISARAASAWFASAMILSLATIAACWLPARRAARQNPTQVLRGE
jgi:putative ABC transport system permease protein